MGKKRQFAQEVAVIAEDVEPQSIAEVSLVWPSTDYGRRPYDSHVIPDLEQIEFRRRCAPGAEVRSPDFIECCKSAKKRVWILDPHAHGDQCLAVLRIVVPAIRAPRVWILSESKPPASELRALQPGGRGVDFQWKTLGKAYCHIIHDRFAIVDQEVWHFGSSVGGGHPTLTAYARGFNAEDTRAIGAFLDIWKRWEGR